MRTRGDNRKIVCGKLDNIAGLGPLPTRFKEKIKLHAERLAPEKPTTLASISVENNVIWFKDRIWQIESFLSHAKSKGIHRLLVLTSKEYTHIAELFATHGIRIDIFEVKYPIFADIKYNRCARINYQVMQKHLKKLRQLKICESNLSQSLACRHQRSVAKKIRFKNGHDRQFFFSYNVPYQEVFKLKEERTDRLIIALDFNSMYVDCMKGYFCDPAFIEYENFENKNINPDYLNNGIYLVRLASAKKSFLLDHHPFRYKRLGQSYYFRMNCGDTIETILHKSEIDFFSPFFEKIKIIEGLFSSREIEHPLLTKGLALYQQRLYHLRRGDKSKEKICKLSMQHMHSSTNQTRYITEHFNSIREVREFLLKNFLLNLKNIDDRNFLEFLCKNKYFQIELAQTGYKLTYINTANRTCIFSLSAQVVSNARLKMLRHIETFLSYESVELCYANVDSIHLSIHRDLANDFLDQHSNLISKKLGALKIETIADQGYWFDVGRYWLKKEGKVVAFKNKGFNYKYTPDPFIEKRKIKILVDKSEFSHFRSHTNKIERDFTYHKKLINSDQKNFQFVRFNFEDISEPHIANETEAKERFRSTRKKIELFQRISGKS